MKCWLQIDDPEEFIDTIPLAPVTRQSTTDEIANCDSESTFTALQSGHINADQALWLHTYNVSWEITK